MYEAVRREAERHGVGIASSELIGFVPRRALEFAAAGFLKMRDFSEGRVLEQRIAERNRGSGDV